MKGSITLIASLLAASTVTLTSSSGYRESKRNPFSAEGHSYYSRFSLDESQRRASLSNNEKFVPKFDGLRFIETLVTAHR